MKESASTSGKKELTDLEFYCLYNIAYPDRFNNIKEHLVERQLLEILPGTGEVRITRHGLSLVEKQHACNSRDTSILCEQLKNIFPGGKKPGTLYYWRCNDMEVKAKLLKFMNIYPGYSNEQIIDATRRYVQENENNPYMQLLKYFIMKQKGDGTMQSMLLTYLENNGNDKQPVDFNTLV